MRLSRSILVALSLLGSAIGCRDASEAAPSPDAAVEEEETLPVLPALDPTKCGIFPEEQLDRSAVTPYAGSTLEEKAFPFLHELDADTPTITALIGDPALAAIERTRSARLGMAVECADAGCVASATAWSDTEINEAADALVSALGAGVAPLASRMRASMEFALHHALDDAGLVRAAFGAEMRSAAKAIADHAPALSVEARQNALRAGLLDRALPFFGPTLLAALGVLAADARDEAIRYEPLADNENAAARAAVATTDWSAFPFAAIIVPGQGPTNHETALSEGSRTRGDLAAQRWNAKLAPFIVPSGGHVHPERAKYSEAIEIKKYLVTLGIPASAIIVDPQARHTTTNFRNTSRLLLRYGVPSARPVLVTSDLGQTLYMIGRPFAVRCQKELGYEPWRALVSLSTTDTCIFMSKTSLHVDASDPLDP